MVVDKVALNLYKRKLEMILLNIFPGFLIIVYFGLNDPAVRRIKD